MKSVTEDKEKQLGLMMMGGVGCFLAGMFFTFLAVMFASTMFFAIGLLSMLVGVALGIGSLFLGFGHNRNRDAGAVAAPTEGRVVARFAINDIGEMIFDNYDFDAEDARFYVRIQFLGGKRDEFECARPVFDQCGEGMRGMLVIEGGWLSQFTALIDTDETKAMYREF